MDSVIKKYMHDIENKIKNKKKIYRVATDFSGIDAPLYALDLLGIKYEYIFGSEINKYCRETIEMNHKPLTLYEDITTRDHESLPLIDLYIAGFPCQCFSALGKRLGFEDKTRGTMFFHCIKTIKVTRPDIFLLENVKGLKHHDNGKTYEIVMDTLKEMEEYDIYSDVYNTKDYGLPQSRPRIYFIGIKKTCEMKFEKPSPINLHVSIKDIREQEEPVNECYFNLTNRGKNIMKDLKEIKHVDFSKDYIINLNTSTYKRCGIRENICVCLCANDSEYYISSWNRKLTERECLNLQGFPSTMKLCSRRRQIYRQAGNTMSINVLCHILSSLL